MMVKIIDDHDIGAVFNNTMSFFLLLFFFVPGTEVGHPVLNESQAQLVNLHIFLLHQQQNVHSTPGTKRDATVFHKFCQI